MRRQQLKTRISALLMAVSLSVVGSFAGVKTIPAAEEMSTTDISLYQEENQTQEKIEVQTETSPQLETSSSNNRKSTVGKHTAREYTTGKYIVRD